MSADGYEILIEIYRGWGKNISGMYRAGAAFAYPSAARSAAAADIKYHT